MNRDDLHRWWARHAWRLMLVAITALTLVRAYMMWQNLPGDAGPVHLSL